MKTVKIAIVGGGLMGREMASAFARWMCLEKMPVKPELVAVADPNADALKWFNNIPSVSKTVADYKELLNDDIDVFYVAVPHHLHEGIYLDVLKAGKDLLAEKPFGIDLDSAKRIESAANSSGRFVRCTSEFPFYPGAQRAYEYVMSGKCGRILEVTSGFHHSSDMDPDKSANWKRQNKTCGEIGVLGDLGMHVCHLPFKLGWRPSRVYAQLSKGYAERPDGTGGTVACDTWDNALLNTWVTPDDGESFPLRFEMKRLAPGETNTWFFEALGTKGGVRFSTKRPKTLEIFDYQEEQCWKSIDLGFGMPFKTITGGIFEPGFPDIIQQMWASFLLEREQKLDKQFACVTADEAVYSQKLFAAALKSQSQQTVENV